MSFCSSFMRKESIASDDSTSGLVVHGPNPSIRDLLINLLQWLIAGFLALPTSLLCLEAGLYPKEKIKGFHSFSEIGHDIYGASLGYQFLSVVTFCSNLYFLSRVYRNFFHLVGTFRDNFSLRDYCKDTPLIDKAKHVIICFSSLFTSLIFASLGMLMLGPLGFILNLFGFWLTRAASALLYFSKTAKKNRARETTILSLVCPSQDDPSDIHDQAVEAALFEFITQNEIKVYLDEKPKLSTINNTLLTLFIILPGVFIGFNPNSVDGFNTLLQQDVGENDGENYSDILSFLVGIPISLLTFIFYSVSSALFVEGISRYFSEAFSEKSNSMHAKLLALSVFSFFGSFGFYASTNTALENGCFDYLDDLKNYIPFATWFSVEILLLANALKALNDQYRGTVLKGDQINANNFRMFISDHKDSKEVVEFLQTLEIT